MRRSHLAAWSFGAVLHLLAAVQTVRFYIRNPKG